MYHAPSTLEAVNRDPQRSSSTLLFSLSLSLSLSFSLVLPRFLDFHASVCRHGNGRRADDPSCSSSPRSFSFQLGGRLLADYLAKHSDFRDGPRDASKSMCICSFGFTIPRCCQPWCCEPETSAGPESCMACLQRRQVHQVEAGVVKSRPTALRQHSLHVSSPRATARSAESPEFQQQRCSHFLLAPFFQIIRTRLYHQSSVSLLFPLELHQLLVIACRASRSDLATTVPPTLAE